ncbi:argininosuccinate synthase-related protein [Streptomyces sp. BK205]|uniref:argininosuccinate synthase-related protein n=1 Tax=Streptomyces sp. BK205 TaxID=2512164 RepID=UPI0010449C62|nr:argininosuccinate synthase-related protein [Streptomyces sp. BK205]TCR16032.1 argininosuccinate synthase [Streptomyces sp. BK205]
MSPIVRSIQDINRLLDPSRPVVTLFSGGLDSTYLLKLLKDAGIPEVVALVVDIGDDLDTGLLAARARHLGAELVVEDGREEFASDFVLSAIQAQAYYLGNHPISSSLSRPLIARKALEVARERRAQAILHSAHPTQNTLRRINGALELLGFSGVFGTPYELTPVPRPIEAAELADAGLGDLSERSVSLDTNLWCREFESGAIDNPEQFTVPEHLYKWTRSGQAPEREAVTVTYRRGVPVELDGRPLAPVRLIEELNRIAGAYRLGRYVGLEHLSGGEKVLEVREMPAAHVLLAGYAHLLSASVDAETIREKQHLDQLWVREALEGRWFGRLRLAAQGFIGSVSAEVTGMVTMSFEAGYVVPTSIRAERPLYIRDREAWEYELCRAAGHTGRAAPAEWPRSGLNGVPAEQRLPGPRG